MDVETSDYHPLLNVVIIPSFNLYLNSGDEPRDVFKRNWNGTEVLTCERRLLKTDTLYFLSSVSVIIDITAPKFLFRLILFSMCTVNVQSGSRFKMMSLKTSKFSNCEVFILLLRLWPYSFRLISNVLSIDYRVRIILSPSTHKFNSFSIRKSCPLFVPSFNQIGFVSRLETKTRNCHNKLHFLAVYRGNDIVEFSPQRCRTYRKVHSYGANLVRVLQL